MASESSSEGTARGPDPIYANVVSMTIGPFDVTMDFGYQGPEDIASQGTGHTVARIAMSVGHAKSMLPLLARIIAMYESLVGTVPAPGFEENEKE